MSTALLNYCLLKVTSIALEEKGFHLFRIGNRSPNLSRKRDRIEHIKIPLSVYLCMDNILMWHFEMMMGIEFPGVSRDQAGGGGPRGIALKDSMIISINFSIAARIEPLPDRNLNKI
jgi:hypothetical protein